VKIAVKINEREVSLLVGEDGCKILELAGVKVAESPFLWAYVYVEESDDLGLWARLSREGGSHLLLMRWEYVLAIDVPAGQPKTLGLR
jgi:hypothetical protein